MKKLIIILLSFFITGCSSLNVTPKNTVINFFNNYKKNVSVVQNELEDYLMSEDLNNDEFKKYKEVYLRQYTNLKYKINDVKINKNKAKVNTLIEVYNYYKVSNESSDYFINNQDNFMNNQGNLDLDKYLNYKLNNLLNEQERINYDLDIYLTKENNIWEINTLSEDDYLKLHGMYYQ